MPKLALLILSILLLSAGLFAAFAGAYLPMYADWLRALAALFLGLGLWSLLRKLSFRYLFLVVPLATLAAYAGISQIWPLAPQVTDMEPAAEQSAPAAPRLFPVQITSGPAEIIGHTLEMPRHWQVNVFAAGLGKARMLELAEDGTLLVSVPDRGRILALPDSDADGVADRTVVYADNLPSVHGLARVGTQLWAVETSRLLRLPDEDRDLRADRIVTQSTDLPGRGGHWTRSLAAGPDGTLYLAAGSSCNACPESDPRRAAVMTFGADAANGTRYATGLRNNVGLAIHPVTGELWGSDNGTDMLGDELPPDEINLIEKDRDYGWPYCFGDRIPDPELGTPQRCRDTVKAAVDLQAHSAPLGITFVDAGRFSYPADQLLLVAYHGSWNRTVPTGYKLVAIPFRNGRPDGPPFDLVRGWLVGGEAWGRPVAPRLGKDGALYVSDDLQGVIYRFRFSGKPAAAEIRSDGEALPPGAETDPVREN